MPVGSCCAATAVRTLVHELKGGVKPDVIAAQQQKIAERHREERVNDLSDLIEAEKLMLQQVKLDSQDLEAKLLTDVRALVEDTVIAADDRRDVTLWPACLLWLLGAL
jgi:hypothetical protein